MDELLKDLPSRGVLQPTAGSLIGRAPPPYICAHDTEPEGDEAADREESTGNFLLSCLGGAKKGKDGRNKVQVEKGADGRKKRPPEAGAENAAAKKQKNGANASKAFTPQQLRAKSNQELSDILKQQGLPSSGKKDILIDRILQARH